MPITDHLLGERYVEVDIPAPDGVTLTWRLRHLDPAEAAHQGVMIMSLGLLGVGARESLSDKLERERRAAETLAQARAEQIETLAALERAVRDEDPGGDADELRTLSAELDAQGRQALGLLRRSWKEPDPRAVREGVAAQQELLCGLVVAAREPDGDWERIELVAREEQQDAAQGRIWVGALDSTTIAQLAAAAWRPVMEAAERQRRFRRAQADGQAAARAARQAGAPIPGSPE